jgi:hypothetical protein
MADLRALYTEEAVGAGHPTKTDVVNRLTLAYHNTDGSHKADNYVALDTTPQLSGDLDKQGYSTDWSLVPAANYTTAPASTSTLTMGVDMTGTIKAGMGLKYTIGGTVYYGMVSAIAANLLTVAGASLTGAVTNLYYGGTVRQVVVIIPGAYEDADNHNLIVTDLKSQLVWKLPTSYCVNFSVYSNTHDSHATHGKASVEINDADVCSDADGLTLAADATWYTTVININTSNYDILPGEVLEITAHKGGTGDASDLTAIMVFVTP